MSNTNQNTNQKKVALYCRVSTRDQNPENQRLELVRYAEAMSLSYEVFEESESSRKTRPIKNEIYLRALRKEFDQIVVWKLDRWGRSLKELVSDLDVFRKNKIGFVSLKDNMTLENSATNNLMFNIIASFADFERSIISERTLLGLSRAKANGVKLGRRTGSTDKKRRRRSGYLLRWQSQKQKDLISV